ncbi:EAL domain-containing protein [Solimicrobium silvestre]|uniref:EAL domain n=1 Tax=Solimicrobium silvestre TaxID=2099400 RepID=A0A2S9H4X8_9BURK|nr:EAL domain-containing protein [Solimicrobium silvestre]PRC94983.1 EAL domain [Solimicrobium silvestre]
MAYQALQKYITHLYTTKSNNTNIWINDTGQAQGRYFNSSLTSAFQALRSTLDLQIVGYQGLARSYTPGQQTELGLSLWRLLDHAASDDESIELDRLCRLLHAINFYRQPQAFGQDIYLNVHSRLLAAIQNNHGAAFRRILDTLELPHQHIVLELPLSAQNQRWILNHVSDNYRSNGFRIAVNINSIEQGLELEELIKQRHFAALKLDSSACHERSNLAALAKLLKTAQKHSTNVIIKRLDNDQQYRAIEQLAHETKQEIYVQGFLFDQPSSSLFSAPVKQRDKIECKKCQAA